MPDVEEEAVLSDLSKKKVMNSGSICNPSSNEIIKENVIGIGEVPSTRRKHGTSPVSNNRAMQDSYSKVTKGDACQDDLFTGPLGNGGNDPIRQLENCTDTFRQLLELEKKQEEINALSDDLFTEKLGNGGSDPIRQLQNCADTFRQLLELEQKQAKLNVLFGRQLLRDAQSIDVSGNVSIPLKERKEQHPSNFQEPQGSISAKSQQESKETEISDLPTDMLFEILARLPVVALSELKFLCKEWNLVLKDPFLSKMHGTLALRNPAGHLLSFGGDLFFAQKSGDNIFSMKLPVSVGKLGDFSLFEHCKWFKSTGKVPQYASCNGLVCYCPREGDMHVFNPITGAHFKLPPVRYRYKCGWGFGCASTDKDYKVICFSGEKRSNDTILNATEIFSFGDDEWREILGLPYHVHGGQICVNGVLYWKVLNGGSQQLFQKPKSGCNMVSFNLHSEIFRERKVFCGYNPSEVSLTLLWDSVGVVWCVGKVLKVSILIDEERDEWVPMFEIPFGISKGLRPAYCDFIFCGLWMNEELFCMEGINLLTKKASEVCCYSYNLVDKAFTLIRLPFTKDVSGDDNSPQLVISHIGNLVSPRQAMVDAKQNSSIGSH